MSAQLDMMPMPDERDPFSLIGCDLGDVPEERWVQGLVDMTRVVEAVYRRQGMSEEAAFAQARDAVMALAEYHGGRMWYLPRGDRLRIAYRDAEIYRRIHRGNVLGLAQEFGLTDSHLYRINRQQKALHLKRIQGRLFED